MRELEATCSDALPEISPVVPHVVTLAEMQPATFIRRDGGVFVRGCPPFYDGDLAEQHTPFAQHARDFGRGLVVVDVLQHVVGDDDIVLLVLHVHGFHVEFHIGINKEIRRDVGVEAFTKDAFQYRLSSEMEHSGLGVAHLREVSILKGKHHQPMPFHGTAVRTHGIQAQRAPNHRKKPLKTAEVALPFLDGGNAHFDEVPGVPHPLDFGGNNALEGPLDQTVHLPCAWCAPSFVRCRQGLSGGHLPIQNPKVPI